MAWVAGAVVAASLASACAGARPPDDFTGPSDPARKSALAQPIESVEVEVDPALGGRATHRLHDAEAPRVLRQSVLDWLEHRERLAPGAGLRVRLRIEALELRSAPSAWLLGGLAAPDRLRVRVEVADVDGLLARFPASSASTLGGWGWRDPDARLLRLSRRLGMQVAEGL